MRTSTTMIIMIFLLDNRKHHELSFSSRPTMVFQVGRILHKAEGWRGYWWWIWLSGSRTLNASPCRRFASNSALSRPPPALAQRQPATAGHSTAQHVEDRWIAKVVAVVVALAGSLLAVHSIRGGLKPALSSSSDLLMETYSTLLELDLFGKGFQVYALGQDSVSLLVCQLSAT